MLFHDIGCRLTLRSHTGKFDPSINMGGGQNLERPNVERPIFQNSKMANGKSDGRSNYSIFYLRNNFFIKIFFFSII